MAEPEEIIARRPSHPVTSTMLIVAALALGGNIYLAVDQLGYYYNRDTLNAIKQGQNNPNVKGKHFANDPKFKGDVHDDLDMDVGDSGGGGTPDLPPEEPDDGGGAGDGGGTEDGGSEDAGDGGEDG